MNICVSIVFKAESKPKYKEKFVCGGFLQKPKTHFFWGPKWYFLKTKFQICVSAFVLYSDIKGSFMPNFTKKILMFGPPGIFLKMKTLTLMRWRPRRACAKILELDF